jgi:hypothetical protein
MLAPSYSAQYRVAVMICAIVGIVSNSKKVNSREYLQIGYCLNIFVLVIPYLETPQLPFFFIFSLFVQTTDVITDITII